MKNLERANSIRAAYFVLPCAVLLLGCAYSIFFCSSTRDISAHAVGTDDAYITYRYARNWVNGQGLAFNPGDRVEGYSNLLYVLMTGLPFLLHWDVFAFSVALNSLFAMGALVILLHHLRQNVGDRLALLGGFLFALSPSIWNWASSGLETTLVLFLQVAIWGLLDRPEPRLSKRALALLCGCTVLLVATRADGFVMPVFAVGYLLMRRQSRPAGVVAVTLFGALAALIAWRLSYYHQPWPNTYYAKVSSSVAARLKSSIREFGGIAARQGHVAYFTAIALCGFRALKEALVDLRSAVRLPFSIVFSLLWICYWLYIGGDNFEDRFLITLVPIGISLLMEVIVAASNVESVQNFIVALAIFIQLVVPVREEQYGKSLQAKYDRWIVLGKFLGESYSGRVLATGAAGKIPYFSNMRTIDMLGLNDLHIAHLEPKAFVVGHSKYDADYVLSQSPDLIFGRFDGDGLDFDLGLPHAKYAGAGYRLKYLLNSSERSRGKDDVIDVTGYSDERIIILAHSGWREAIAERAPGYLTTTR